MSSDPRARPQHLGTGLEPTLAAAIDDIGYAITRLFPDDVVAAIRQRYRELATPVGSEMSIDYDQPDRSRREATRELMAPIWREHLVAVAPRHRMVLTTFAVKPPGPRSSLGAHDDRSMVDERTHRALVVWVPLVDTSPALGNGCLQVLPHSHELDAGMSGTGIPPWFGPFRDWIDERLVPVSMSAGEALVYDARLLHASGNNVTDADREAVLCALVPESAQPAHAVALGPHRRRLLHVDEEFFVRFSPEDLRRETPAGYEVLHEDVELDVADPVALLARLDRGAAPAHPRAPEWLDAADRPEPPFPLDPRDADAAIGRELVDLVDAVARQLAQAEGTSDDPAPMLSAALGDPGPEPGGQSPNPAGPGCAPLERAAALAPSLLEPLERCVRSRPQITDARVWVLPPGSSARLPGGAGVDPVVVLAFAACAGTVGLSGEGGVEMLRPAVSATTSGESVVWNDGPWIASGISLTLASVPDAPSPPAVGAPPATAARPPWHSRLRPRARR